MHRVEGDRRNGNRNWSSILSSRNPYSPMATWSLKCAWVCCTHLLELLLSCKSQKNVSENRVQLSTAKLLSVNHVFSMNLTLCRLFNLFVHILSVCIFNKYLLFYCCLSPFSICFWFLFVCFTTLIFLLNFKSISELLFLRAFEFCVLFTWNILSQSLHD